ncbi:MAG TPA: protein kinase [Planctomycetota bacterium]|nr:protein kinase [Planctomycetota bacterium]
MVITCPSCGTQSEGEKNCPDCGKPMPLATVTAGPPVVRSEQPATEPKIETKKLDRSASTRSSGATSSALLRSTPVPRSIDGYEIIKPIGSGGMGSVYLAYEPLLDRQVALKVLSRSADDAARTQDAARFLSEAVLTGRLTHAGIIPIYHVGFDPAHGYYYTMRYVKGRTLGAIIARLAAGDPAVTEEFRLNRLLSIFVRVCEAVGFAHSQGIVHRDIKPANIMVADFGEVLVLDWGLAKNTRGEEDFATMDDAEVAAKLAELRRRRMTTSRVFLLKDQRKTGAKKMTSTHPDMPLPMTRNDQVLGTPGYLSPEQGQGITDVTPESDVYSLGVTLYELLTLTLPADSNDSRQLLERTVHGEIVPIRKRPQALQIPRVLCDIVERCLSLQPRERFRSARELAEEISLYLEGKAAWRPLADDTFGNEGLGKSWKLTAGSAQGSSEGLAMEAGSTIRCLKNSLGDLQCNLELWADSSSERWTASFRVLEAVAQSTFEQRYEIRLGVEERPFLELLRNGRRVQRRFDIRLQASQRYAVQLEMEQSHLRLSIDGRRYLDFREVFPQTGGAIEVHASLGRLYIKRFELLSRGAPLNLSYMVLPDRLYRTGRFAEARELYHQLAASHPDREEGLMALYKAGLCSTALDDLQAAFRDFSRLEGSMYDHCCALGMAQIGMRDGNIDWAWQALKNGYRRHRLQNIRSEIWFALLGLVEHLRTEEKIKRYRELLFDLDPEPQEAGQITFGLLDMILQVQGNKEVREEALALLKRFPDNHFLLGEALLALCRAGIDGRSLPIVTSALDHAMRQRSTDVNMARFHILRAEVEIAEGRIDEAFRQLRDAIIVAGPGSPEGQWAKCWQVLIQYLNGQYQQALMEVHEILARFRRTRTKQHGYLRLIEALAYLGKGQVSPANTSFRSAAEVNCVWGCAASNFITGLEPPSLAASATYAGPNQLVEAMFLLGDAYLLTGKKDVAKQYYEYCLHPDRERAMIVRFARQRLNQL